MSGIGWDERRQRVVASDDFWKVLEKSTVRQIVRNRDVEVRYSKSTSTYRYSNMLFSRLRKRVRGFFVLDDCLYSFLFGPISQSQHNRKLAEWRNKTWVHYDKFAALFGTVAASGRHVITPRTPDRRRDETQSENGSPKNSHRRDGESDRSYDKATGSRPTTCCPID